MTDCQLYEKGCHADFELNGHKYVQIPTNKQQHDISLRINNMKCFTVVIYK